MSVGIRWYFKRFSAQQTKRRTDGRTDRRYRDDRLLYIGRTAAATPDNQSFRIHGNSRTCTLHTLSLGDHLHRSRREPPFQRPNCQSVCRHRFNRPLHCPHRPYYSQTQKSPAPPIPNTPIIRCTTAHGDHNFCTTRSRIHKIILSINGWRGRIRLCTTVNDNIQVAQRLIIETTDAPSVLVGGNEEAFAVLKAIDQTNKPIPRLK